jgi:hypothetical protein
MIGLFSALALVLAQASSPETASSATPAPLACGTDDFAAFDFWLGDWDVYPNGTERLVAHSRIERLHSGCAIRETWMPLAGSGGSSLSNLDPETGRWHQTWIGSSPGRVEFVGGSFGGEMILNGYWKDIGGPGVDGLVRMSYTAISPDEVRQHGEVSLDHGLTWQDSFDLIYKRHQAE